MILFFCSTNIEEKMLSRKFRLLKMLYFPKLNTNLQLTNAMKLILSWEIRKVKAVSPSPLYDGKYHPPEN
jgi:hypothetical protein